MKKRLSILVMVGIMMIAFTVWNGMQTEAAGGSWKKDSAGWWYQYTDGSYPQNTWLKIGGSWYHFNSKGYMQTGWQKISGKWYYMGSDGRMVTGQKYIGENLSFFRNDGVWIKTRYPSDEGWWYESPKGIWFEYFDGSYPSFCDAKIDGKYYNFDPSGYVRTGWYNLGEPEYPYWRYGGSDGAIRTGWQKLSGKWYFFFDDPEYCSGEFYGLMFTGLCTVRGSYYYFGTDGAMQTGWKSIDGNFYYFCSDGAAATGAKVIGGKTYYFTSEGVWYQ